MEELLYKHLFTIERALEDRLDIWTRMRDLDLIHGENASYSNMIIGETMEALEVIKKVRS